MHIFEILAFQCEFHTEPILMIFPGYFSHLFMGKSWIVIDLYFAIHDTLLVISNLSLLLCLVICLADNNRGGFAITIKDNLWKLISL